MGSMTIGQPRK